MYQSAVIHSESFKHQYMVRNYSHVRQRHINARKSLNNLVEIASIHFINHFTNILSKHFNTFETAVHISIIQLKLIRTLSHHCGPKHGFNHYTNFWIRMLYVVCRYVFSRGSSTKLGHLNGENWEIRGEATKMMTSLYHGTFTLGLFSNYTSSSQRIYISDPRID